MNAASRPADESHRSPLDRLVGGLDRLVPIPEEEKRAVKSLPHEVRSVVKGTLLVEANLLAADCFVMLDAFAHKEKFFGDLRRVVSINLPGELVNIESALAMQSDYSATIIRSGEIVVIPAEALRELLFDCSSLSRALWLRSQAEAAVSREWLLNDRRRGLESRLAHLICETSLRLQLLNEEDEAEPVLPFDVEELALAAGSIPLYVCDALALLENAKAVRLSDEGVTIEDGARLAEIGDFDPTYIEVTHSR